VPLFPHAKSYRTCPGPNAVARFGTLVGAEFLERVSRYLAALREKAFDFVNHV
jgi:hypothetical protein